MRGHNVCFYRKIKKSIPIFSGNDKGTAGVGMFVAEEWIEKVFEVQRVSDRIL